MYLPMKEKYKNANVSEQRWLEKERSHEKLNEDLDVVPYSPVLMQ